MTLRLNLACGSDVRVGPEWRNLDVVKQWPNSPLPCNEIWDARSDRIPYPDTSVDQIVAGYLFLHVNYKHHEPLAREMFRVLKPGGRLEIGEVDMPVAMRRWMMNPYDQSAREILWGEQGVIHGEDLAQYDKHCAGHTEATLRALLIVAGFTKPIHRFKQHSVWYEMSMHTVKP